MRAQEESSLLVCGEGVIRADFLEVEVQELGNSSSINNNRQQSSERCANALHRLSHLFFYHNSFFSQGHFTFIVFTLNKYVFKHM